LTVHGSALDEDGGEDVVALADVRQQFREHVSTAPLPKMMVSVDDRQIRLEDLFVSLGEPFIGREIHALDLFHGHRLLQ
jgi:hypothetical protein